MSSTSLYSGRLDKKKSAFLNNVDKEEDQLDLLVAIASGKPIRKKAEVSRHVARYAPIYRHPLPVSDRRFFHEMTLNRVLCAKIEDQAAAAVSLGDPWVLEEIYMRGAPVEVPGESGYRPIHLAVQKNQFECIMVLIGIGVDINVVTVSGVTPLYMARAAGATQAMDVLIEKGAKLIIDPMRIAPGVTVLEVDKPVRIEDKVSKYVGLPTKNLWY